MNLEGHTNIFNPNVVKEIEKLKKHMERGCLSGIPVNFGTNRNENLHRSINHRLAGHRIGIELADALLSVFFHMWNMKRSGKSNTSMCSSYLSYNSTDTQIGNSHHLGLGISAERMYSEQHLGTAFCHSNDTMEVMGQIEKLKNTLPPSEPPEKLQTQLTTIKSILNIMQLALSCVSLEDTIHSLSNTHPKVSRVTPSLSSLIKEQVITVNGAADDENLHSKRLANVLESYQLDTIDIAKDGDCLFSSVATYIKQICTSPITLPESLLDHLQIIGISGNQITSGITLVPYLRELLVHEWLANQCEYQPFFDGVIHDFEAESIKYLQCGVFSSNLGDAMLLGLSNVLRIPIVVFTSVESWPYFTIHPRTAPVDSRPILLAFLQAGPGHYSLAVQKEVHESSPLCTSKDNPTENVKTCKTASCRCGRGRNASDAQRLNCSKSSNYSSRCPCLRSSRACTSNCTCLNCDNQFGKQCMNKPKEITVRRKRPRHEEQELGRTTSGKYMKSSGELPLLGKWTRTEHYVLLVILHYLCGDKISSSMDQLDSIVDIYNTVVKVVVKNDILLSIAPKSQTQIKAKIQQCLKEQNLLKECGIVNILPV